MMTIHNEDESTLRDFTASGDGDRKRWERRLFADRCLGWVRSCAACGFFLPPVAVLCPSCWNRLDAFQNRGECLRRTDYPFPVYSLFTWNGDTNPWLKPLITGLKGGRAAIVLSELAERLAFERSLHGPLRDPVFLPPARYPEGRQDHAWAFSWAIARVWQKDPVDVLGFAKSAEAESEGDDEGKGRGKGKGRDPWWNWGSWSSQSAASQKALSAGERRQRRFVLRKDFHAEAIRHEHEQDERAGPSIECYAQKTVVFVDDVITTGSTAMAAYIALGDPENFEVWTLAHRPKLAGSTGV